MNWKRGFLRFWIVASALWIAFALLIGLWVPIVYFEQQDFLSQTNIALKLICLVLLPPGVLFFVGLALIWVATGFTNRGR